MKQIDEQYSDDEATRRMNDALRRALNTPPQPQATVRRPRNGKKAGEGPARPKRPSDAGA